MVDLHDTIALGHHIHCRRVPCDLRAVAACGHADTSERTSPRRLTAFHDHLHSSAAQSSLLRAQRGRSIAATMRFLALIPIVFCATSLVLAFLCKSARSEVRELPARMRAHGCGDRPLRGTTKRLYGGLRCPDTEHLTNRAEHLRQRSFL